MAEGVNRIKSKREGELQLRVSGCKAVAWHFICSLVNDLQRSIPLEASYSDLGKIIPECISAELLSTGTPAGGAKTGVGMEVSRPVRSS